MKTKTSSNSAPGAAENEEPDFRLLVGKPGVAEWLQKQLAISDKEIRVGPAGFGWNFNQTKRKAVEGVNGLLHGLADLLTAIK